MNTLTVLCSKHLPIFTSSRHRATSTFIWSCVCIHPINVCSIFTLLLAHSNNSWDKYLCLLLLNVPLCTSARLICLCLSVVWCWAGRLQLKLSIPWLDHHHHSRPPAAVLHMLWWLWEHPQNHSLNTQLAQTQPLSPETEPQVIRQNHKFELCNNVLYSGFKLWFIPYTHVFILIEPKS